MWLEAVELRIDADLATGRHADLVRELSALARRYPLREHIHRQLMLALYRSGRQAEALEAYAELRRTLVEELGLEPSRELRALQEAMLRQDPELDLRRPGAVRVVPRRRRRLGLALVVSLAALALVGLFALLGSEETPEPPRADGVVVAVSPRSGEVQARVPVGATPSAVAVGEGRVWVLNADDQTISRIDPRSRASDTFAIGATPTDLAVGAGAVWVGSGGAVPRGQSTRDWWQPRWPASIPAAALRARRSACRLREQLSPRTRSPITSPSRLAPSGRSAQTSACGASTRGPTASRPRSPVCVRGRSRRRAAASGPSRATAP